ncbi:restriction endonuclease subunit S [Patescibacteria group bacterium]|nr:restriction endonuclease subunit S [Patescibacteria group bacterium]
MKRVKQTELGELPEEWEVVRLGDEKVCGNMFYGITAKATENNTGLKMLRTTDIKDYTASWNALPFCEITESRNNLDKYVLKGGEIVIARAGTVGVSVLVDRDLDNTIFGSYLIKVKLKPTSNPKFIHYFLQSNLYWKHIGKAQGSTMKNINLPLLKSLILPLPPLPEQRKIASILSTVDEAIQKTNEIISKTQELKKGLMQELLTKGIGHKKFKKTEIGKIPEEWEVVRLGEIVKVQGGYAFKSQDYIQNGLRLFKISNVSQGTVVWDDVSYLPKTYEKEYTDYLLNEGDIVIAMTRPIIGNGLKIARINKNDLPCILNQRVGRFKTKTTNVSLEFIFYTFFSKRLYDEVKKRSLALHQPNISSTEIENISIARPPLPEQRKIASILSTVDEKIEIERNRKQKLEKLKKGLMQVLLTGKVRVKVS